MKIESRIASTSSAGDFMGTAESLVRREQDIAELGKRVRDRMSKGAAAKAMKLPPLLEKRRKLYSIPDGVFRQQCLFDRVFIYQLAPEDFTEKAGKESLIYLPETAREYIKDETPRGIIVGAGALAMDELLSNGVDLGHIVYFTKLAPYRLIVDVIDSKPFSVLVMLSGNLVASEDLEIERREGTKRIEFTGEEHRWVDVKKKTKATRAAPKRPWMPDSE